MKDQVTAQNLLEEIETARLHHPTTRQSTAFSARVDALMKRFHLRGNPAASTSGFPRPVHPLFPDQHSVNASLAQALSSEIGTAMISAKKVEIAAKEYRDACDSIRRVEDISQDASGLSASFASIIDRLENGVTFSHGDGSPLDLSTEKCLEPASHSVFLALLPSTLEELDTTSVKADQLSRNVHAAHLILGRPGIDPSFKAKVVAEFKRLTANRERARALGNEAHIRASRLREVKKVWSIMGEHLKELEGIRRHLGDAMETHRWRQQSGSGDKPLTPESPFVSQFPTAASSDLATQLDHIQERLVQDIESPLSAMSSSLEPSLNEWLTRSFRGLTGLLGVVRQMTRLLETIKRQAEVMGTVRCEFEDFQIRIEDTKLGFDSAIQQVLHANLPQEPLSPDIDLQVATTDLRKLVQTFIDNLSQRVPFVSQRDLRVQGDGTFVKRRFSSQDLKLGASLEQVTVEVPFDLSSLDDTVRGDSNSYAMRLAGELERMDQKVNHFHLAQMVKEMDLALSSTVDGIDLAAEKLASFRASLSAIVERDDEMERLQSLSTALGDFSQEQRATIRRSFSPLRERLRHMDSAPGAHDAAVREIMYLSRVRAVDDAELKFTVWNADVETLRNLISDAQSLHAQRLEQERLAEELRVKAEMERLADEERLRREQEQLEAERVAEEQQVQMEKDRQTAKEVERLTLEQQRLEAEEKMRVEDRVAEERRLQDEQESTAIEEARKQKYERERQEEGQRLREEEELRLQAEIERQEKSKREQEQLVTAENVLRDTSLNGDPTGSPTRDTVGETHEG